MTSQIDKELPELDKIIPLTNAQIRSVTHSPDQTTEQFNQQDLEICIETKHTSKFYIIPRSHNDFVTFLESLQHLMELGDLKDKLKQKDDSDESGSDNDEDLKENLEQNENFLNMKMIIGVVFVVILGIGISFFARFVCLQNGGRQKICEQT